MIQLFTKCFKFLVRRDQAVSDIMLDRAADQLFALGLQYKWWKDKMHWREFDPMDQQEFRAAAASILQAGCMK